MQHPAPLVVGVVPPNLGAPRGAEQGLRGLPEGPFKGLCHSVTLQGPVHGTAR